MNIFRFRAPVERWVRHFSKIHKQKSEDEKILKVWIKAERIDNRQSIFGETVSIILTTKDDPDNVIFKAGPYTIHNGQMISHELLIGRFHQIECTRLT